MPVPGVILIIPRVCAHCPTQVHPDKDNYLRDLLKFHAHFLGYLSHQDIYYDENYYDEYKVYHAETSLYCICVGKERELIWRGMIDITDPSNIKNVIDDYITLVVLAMEEQDLIFHKETDEEDSTSL